MIGPQGCSQTRTGPSAPQPSLCRKPASLTFLLGIVDSKQLQSSASSSAVSEIRRPRQTTATDFQLATEKLLRHSLASFSVIPEKFLRSEPLSSQTKLLSLFNDERSTMRSFGRLQCTPLSAGTRMPIVLDAQNALTRLLILLPRNLSPRWSRLRQVIPATIFFWRPCRSVHHQLSLLPMPLLPSRKCRANDGAFTPMPIPIYKYAISVRQHRSRCISTVLHCQRKAN